MAAHSLNIIPPFRPNNITLTNDLMFMSFPKIYDVY